MTCPSRKPPKHVQLQALRLDRKYLRGNYLTIKEIERGFLFWFLKKNTLIAYLLLEQYRDTYKIRSIVVVPEARERGLASKLLKSCIRWVRKQKIKTIHTYSNAFNYPSINLLIGLGFKIIKFSTTYYKPEKKHIPWLSYRKTL